MYNDKYHDYKVNVKGKNFFLELDFTNKILYSWESAAAHLAEGSGGSVSFKELQESEGWQDFIRRTYGDEILEEVLQKVSKALKR
jgi:hypothetical protein